MSVRIRMKRLGRTHRPFYRICIMDHRKARDGKTIEEIGTYDPMIRDKSKRVTLDMERVDYWMSVGAKPTEKVGVLINKFKEDRWTAVKELPPLTAPKQPEPEPEPAAEGEAVEGETSADGETGEEAASAPETGAEEAGTEEASAS